MILSTTQRWCVSLAIIQLLSSIPIPHSTRLYDNRKSGNSIQQRSPESQSKVPRSYILWRRDGALCQEILSWICRCLHELWAPCHVMRANLFRYLVLYKFGGVYMDLDGKCVKSFDQWWTFPHNQRVDQKQFLGLNFGMCNGIRLSDYAVDNGVRTKFPCLLQCS